MKRIAILAGAGSLAAVGILATRRPWRRSTLRGHGESVDEAVDVPRRAPASVAGATATRIAPDVYLLGPWGRTQTNAYLVDDGSSWVLVDAGWKNDGPRIEAAVGSLLGPGRVPSAILLTHAHPDHAGSARGLPEPGAARSSCIPPSYRLPAATSRRWSGAPGRWTGG